MAAREKNTRLQKLFDEGKNVYSHSKLSTINNCLYSSYLTYVRHEKGSNNIYALAGGKIHDKLEEIINGVNNESILLPTLYEELDDYEMLGISFPKDRNGEDSIRNGWISNMTHFCNTFKKPKGKFITEEFLILKVDEEHYLQGYCDLIKIVDEKNKIVSVYDWKTSSQFSKDDLIHHGRQLVIYQMALEQLGYTVKECAWIMLKYCTIQYMGKKRSNSKTESLIEKVCERRKIVQELKSDIELRLINSGYSEIDVEIMLNESLENNSINNLPDEIKNRYKVIPYVRKYEVTDEAKEECMEYIKKTSELWESLDENETSYLPRKFTKITSTGKVVDDIFFCLNLCNHKNCPHLRKYLDTKQNSTEDEDLF
ncbi:PD-(D/E)XK nuclease superfamily protein [Clostridium sp. C105KSO15]|nr:PD-(D/E)XK nuclease superfamily protein [Clostridium sp. C105KSO15]